MQIKYRRRKRELPYDNPHPDDGASFESSKRKETRGDVRTIKDDEDLSYDHTEMEKEEGSTNLTKKKTPSNFDDDEDDEGTLIFLYLK